MSTSSHSSKSAASNAESTERKPKEVTFKSGRVARKLGVALVGLGRYASEELGPALKETDYCELTSVVSGSRDKRKQWQREYGLKDRGLYGYKDFDRIADNDDVDIVYVVLPNALHAEYVIRAARAGKHVICEKPLATSLEDCDRMLRACHDAGVRLATGYRLHYDPYNLEMIRLAEQAVYGKVTSVFADDSMTIEKPEWRLDHTLAGGGPLMNNGVYCVQAAIYLIGTMPLAVRARFMPDEQPSMPKSVEAGVEWEMIFPEGRRASCVSTYNRDGNVLRAEAEEGLFQLAPAYEYRGLHGQTPDGNIEFPTINQQAAQMDDFAYAIHSHTTPKVTGEMGMRDVEIMMAIYESAKTGKEIELQLHRYATDMIMTNTTT